MDNNDTLPICAGNETDCNNNSTVEDNDQCLVPYPSFAPPAVDYVQAAVTVLIIVLSITINSIIVHLITCFKQLWQRSFFLALQAIVINLVFTALVLPTVVVTSILRSWVFGSAMCGIIGGSNTFFFTGQYLMLVVMALDRFLTVFMPFFYDRHGNKIAVGMSIITWSYAFFDAIISTALGCTTFVPMYKTCIGAFCNKICAVIVNAHTGIVTLSSIIVPLVVYMILYLKGKQLQHETNVGMSPEERAKTAFNGRICKTFAIIAVAFLGVILISFSFYGWFILAPDITTEFYIIQCFAAYTLASCTTITNPIIILRNRDVYDAWAEHRR